MKENKDTEILNLLKINIEVGFKELVNIYKKDVYRHIRRMVIDHDDADDLTQETFIKVWLNINKFKGESKLYTWIYQIATNETLNFLKKKKKFSFFSVNNEELDLLNKLHAPENFRGDFIEKKLNEAIIKLPDKQRLVFNMKYFEDFSYEQMSKILNTSEGALKASYHHAVKKIEKYVSDN
ncbi:MAG: RNA polymerase subunit sigma [Bacteroidetes bacterium GWE2_29_8]|nr:MAG: RNA polymerase subunit sigma [Bacteroidetes bacterium GWE2_29_8]OFY15559.1 MAG: RNA polymerase subunit sigma [Bacteroidetes bacterium GWF2_29_10]